MVIQKESDIDDPYWSNLLELDDPHPRTLDLFLAVLQGCGISLPFEMIDEIQQDKQNDAKNKTIEHFVENGNYCRIDLDEYW